MNFSVLSHCKQREWNREASVCTTVVCEVLMLESP